MTLINTTVTLKSNLDYSNADFKKFKLPNIASGTYVWNAQINDLNGLVISRDTAEWEFTSTAKTTTNFPECNSNNNYTYTFLASSEIIAKVPD